MEHKAYWALKFLNFDHVLSTEKRKLQLQELEELRLTAYKNSKNYKEKVKMYHDKMLLNRQFQPGQQVLLFNSRFKIFQGKLKSKWSGPFTIKEVKPHGAIELVDPTSDDPKRSWVVNGQRLKHYLRGKWTTVETLPGRELLALSCARRPLGRARARGLRKNLRPASFFYGAQAPTSFYAPSDLAFVSFHWLPLLIITILLQQLANRLQS
ncbi:hypothetical protein LR48_Vigan11g139300 [Vigna angularis]|uniref:Reverse transcriptase domain-containing protein n=1 Tax=Phaseolus angularis TaxID=3914 RepID=A0A0L9VUB2_PHAAN|nr:hypothetical protein LR48_Vigan11g139300 [Vigna angularis]